MALATWAHLTFSMLRTPILVFDFLLDGHIEKRLIALSPDREAVIGTVNVQGLGRAAATVFQLFVVPEWRQRGVGRKLMETVEGLILASGSRAVSAIVMDQGPIGFYAALGYEPMHHERGQTIVAKRLK